MSDATFEVRDNSQEISFSTKKQSPFYVGAKASVKEVAGGAEITCEDKAGRSVAIVRHGADGVGVSAVSWNAEHSELAIELTNGSKTVIQGLKGERGERGERGQDGSDGENGAQGVPGKDGAGITNITFNDDYTLTIEYADGKVVTTTSIRGAAGAIGTLDTVMSDTSSNAVRNSVIKAYIDSAIGGISEFDTIVSNQLPSSGKKGALYLVPNAHGANDNYDEYVWVNGAFEKVGNTAIDLAGYVKIDSTEYLSRHNVEVGAQRNAVASVNGKAGEVLITQTDIGLGRVNNTADEDKSVAYANISADVYLDRSVFTLFRQLGCDC